MKTDSGLDPRKLHIASQQRLPGETLAGKSGSGRRRPFEFAPAAQPARAPRVPDPDPAQTTDTGSKAARTSAVAILPTHRAVPCSTCYVRSTCLFSNTSHAHDNVDTTVTGQLVRSGHVIYSQGEPCRAIYRVRVGSVKTDTTAAGGTQQVQGFYVAGDVFGLEAVGNGSHTCSAVALEDTSLCSLPLSRLHSIVAADGRRLQRLLTVLAEDNAAHLNLRMLLNHSSAVQRVAAFLQWLAQRLGSQSLSNTEFRLSMSRYDIASYLGTAPETISRALSKLTREGLITVAGKSIRIDDHAGLAYYADPELNLQNGTDRREA